VTQLDSSEVSDSSRREKWSLKDSASAGRLPHLLNLAREGIATI
jgi:hypothetical protein